MVHDWCLGSEVKCTGTLFVLDNDYDWEKQSTWLLLSLD